MLLRASNQKLGGIWSFSLPAGHTCPGKTTFCESKCYAKKGRFVFPSVKQALFANFKASKQDDFVSNVNAEIKANRVTQIRIHSAGDFYSSAYANKWLQIMQGNRQVLFTAYTRSWRDSSIYPVLVNMAKLTNFNLFLSSDLDCPEVIPIPGARIAYMAIDDSELITCEPHVVFRVKRNSVVRRHSGFLVCPPEQGSGLKVGCEQCQLCYSRVDTLDRKISLPVLV